MSESLQSLSADANVRARLAAMQPPMAAPIAIQGRKPNRADLTLIKVRTHAEYLHRLSAKRGNS